MSLVQGIITTTGQTVDIEIPTARIPELPELGDPIEGQDQLAVYDVSENSTRQRTLSDIRAFILTGSGGGGTPPTVNGNDVEIIADDTNISGDNRVLIPILENKEYTLEQVGYGQLLSSQFLILPSGGFELSDRKVRKGDVFFAHLFNTTPGGSGPGSATSLVNGIAIIADDTTINTSHYNKLLHVSSPTKNVAVTLPEITDAPPNLMLMFETTLSNDYWTKIQTQAGQFIYLGGQAVTYVWLAKNEFLWLLRGADGWYVMKASDGLLTAGQPFFDVVQRINTLVLKGQEVPRSSVPRIMDLIAANPLLMVSETDWQNTYEQITTDSTQLMRVYTKRGLFSDGDGSTTIRLPDYQNMSMKALNFIGNLDPERNPNRSGVIQKDMVRKHEHFVANDFPNGSGTPLSGGNSVNFQNEQGGAGDFKYTLTGTVGEPTRGLSSTTGGFETRPVNVGLLPLMRL